MQTIFSLSCGGITAQVCAFGASLVSVSAPDRTGRAENILLSLQAPDGYDCNEICAGATVGPVAGRITEGKVVIGGREYMMNPPGQAGPCLHSGPGGLQNRLWKTEQVQPDQVVFSAVLEDGECGLPGRRTFHAEYTLRNDVLSICITAVSDRPTFVNPTNHAYWNLSGDFSRPARQTLRIAADWVWYNDEEHLPVKLQPVKETPFDFTAPAIPLERIRTGGSIQLEWGRGYNHAFVLDGSPAAVLCHPESGRRLTLETDAPALVVYTGGFLGQETALAGGGAAVPGCAFALEPQLMPDAPRHMGDALPLLLPGEVFRRKISYRFSCL